MWATEVQRVDIETLPKFEERELFRTYVEDFNTGTLPHRKYYNLELYERRRAEKAAKKNKPLVRAFDLLLLHNLPMRATVLSSVSPLCPRGTLATWKRLCSCLQNLAAATLTSPRHG